MLRYGMSSTSVTFVTYLDSAILFGGVERGTMIVFNTGARQDRNYVPESIDTGSARSYVVKSAFRLGAQAQKSLVS
jgi:hypothetical protein